MTDPQDAIAPEPIEDEILLDIGTYYFSPGWTEGKIWLYHESGEGMEVDVRLLEENIDKFYKENF